LGLASHLRVFPRNKIAKGALAMQLKESKDSRLKHLPIVTWETCKLPVSQKLEYLAAKIVQSRGNPNLEHLLISGIIHDVSSFLDHHPGGRSHLETSSGKKTTVSFFGGVYTHSNAAHNLLLMMRVGMLAGG
ncbi:hypothetical protein K443DRAFT_56167, partial [Laccaria amethystina LaAM-08-1]